MDVTCGLRKAREGSTLWHQAEEVNQFQPSKTQFHVQYGYNQADAQMQLQTFQNQAHHPSTIGLSNINNSSS
jgi:hypothetical protein